MKDFAEFCRWMTMVGLSVRIGGSIGVIEAVATRD